MSTKDPALKLLLNFLIWTAFFNSVLMLTDGYQGLTLYAQLFRIQLPYTLDVEGHWFESQSHTHISNMQGHFYHFLFDLILMMSNQTRTIYIEDITENQLWVSVKNLGTVLFIFYPVLKFITNNEKSAFIFTRIPKN